MIIKDVREYLAEQCPEAIVFDEPSFDRSIVGTTDDGGVVYDYYDMVDEFATEYSCTHEDAEDYICYKTLRAIPSANGMGVLPTILYPLM